MENKERIFTLNFVISLIACVLLTIFFNTYIASFALVVGPSMEPTMETGDLVIMEKLTQEYERYDIVVLDASKGKYIKRVIGTPGDTIQIIAGKVFINGSMIDDVVDCYTASGIAEEPITLNDDEYFVLGDNRGNSLDSRFEELGVVNKKQINGKVFFSVVPFSTTK